MTSKISSPGFIQLISIASSDGLTNIASAAGTPTFNRIVIKGLGSTVQVASSPFTLAVSGSAAPTAPNVPTSNGGTAVGLGGNIPADTDVAYEFLEVQRFWALKLLSAAAISIVVETSMV